MKFLIPILLYSQVLTKLIQNINEYSTNSSKAYNGILKTSKYLNNTSMSAYSYPPANKSTDLTFDTDTQNPYEVYTLPLHETSGALIQNVVITKDNVTLQAGVDYSLASEIDPDVFPNDYFTGYQCKDCKADRPMDCLYVNPGPTHSMGVFHNLGVDRYVTFYNYNFGINSTKSGIQVIKVSNFTLEVESLDNFLQSHNKDLTVKNSDLSTDAISFRHIHASNPQFDPNDYLIGEATDGTLYIYRMLQTIFDEAIFTIEYYSKIPITQFNISDFNQIDVYNSYLVLGGSEGFIVANNTGVDSWDVLFKTTNMKVNDFIVNDKTVYVLENKFGMRIFDLVTLKFTDFEFQHPALAKFDYTLDPITGIYYVGITVNNSPPDIYEILIELIVHDGDFEYQPIINKVYTSLHKIPSSNIVTDQLYGVTYVYDNFDVYILNRYIPEKYNFYFFMLNFKDYLTKNFKDIATKSAAYLLSEYGNGYKGVLLIQNNNDFLAMRDFKFPMNVLACNITQEGSYTFSYKSDQNCPGLDFNGPQQLDLCNTNYVYPVVVGGASDKSLLWAILVFLVIIALVSVCGVVCYRKGCFNRGRGSGANKYNPQHVEAGVLEVHVDGKSAHSRKPSFDAGSSHAASSHN
jgi:hypothetical protein